MPSKKTPAEVFPDLFPPRVIRIVGAGRFGRIAAERLKRRFPNAEFSITDRDGPRLENIANELGIRAEVEESIINLTRMQLNEDVWVIPAVPLHLGFEWLVHELGRSGEVKRSPVPHAVSRMVPNPTYGPSGTLYASFATFICPDHCSEPDEICTHTGKARTGNLFEIFGAVRIPGFEVFVLRSWQLSPGVGGYPVRSLNALFSAIAAKPGRYLVATSCRCHGVMDCLELRN